MKYPSSGRLEPHAVGAVIAAVLALALCATPVAAQRTDRLRAEAYAMRAAERLEALQREADQLAASERTLLNDLRKLELDQQIKAEQLQQLNAEAKTTATELEATTARLTALEKQDAHERAELATRLTAIYKLGSARYLRLLLSTSDVREVGRAARLVGALAEADRARVVVRQHTMETLREARATLDRKQRRLAALRGDAVRLARAAADAAQARSELIRDIDRRRDLNAQFAGELLAAQQRLQTTLRGLSSDADTAAAAPLPIGPFRGTLDWPVNGAVRRRFGAGPSARSPVSSGLEIASTSGTAVQAVHDGTVAFAGPFEGFGNLVIVDHGAQSFSLYGDLLEIDVSRGAAIERGQRVGAVGAAPAGPPGLYFELRIDGRPVDPLQWLKPK